MKRAAALIVTCLLMTFAVARAAEKVNASAFMSKSDNWLISDDGSAQLARIISWQRPEGGWEKEYDAANTHVKGAPYGNWSNVGTIDNNLTYDELRLLARAFRVANRDEYAQAVNRGIDYLLQAQYPSGGWPQRYPLPDNYGKAITYNDNAMTNVLRLLTDITKQTPDFAFVNDARRLKCREALQKGIDCTLKLQITSGGKLTAWAQQYDADTLKPCNARAFELAGIASSESAGVIKFLMEIEDPTPAEIKAIRAAAAWFEASKIEGKRLEKKGVEFHLVDDARATPLWSRFYEIDTNRPFFCGRDGIKKYSIEELDAERAGGYAWLRDWGKTVAANYAKWSSAHPE